MLKKSYAVLLVLLAVSAVMTAGCTDSPAQVETSQSDLNTVLDSAAAAVDSRMTEMCSLVENLAEISGEYGIDSSEAHDAMAEGYQKCPYLLSLINVGSDDIIKLSYPEEYEGVLTGADISSQRRSLDINGSVLSGYYHVLEGYDAVSLISPIYVNGTKLGYSDVTIIPGFAFAQDISSIINGTNYSIWIVQTDGTLIYDTSSSEIGKNVLKSEIYQDPELNTVMNEIVTNDSGRSGYSFMINMDESNIVRKDAVWKSINCGGMTWRIVATHYN